MQNKAVGNSQKVIVELLLSKGADVNASNKFEANVKEKSMEESMPIIFKKLDKILKNLEKHYKDMQDVELPCLLLVRA